MALARAAPNAALSLLTCTYSRSMRNEPGQTAMHPESPASPAAAPPAAVLAVLSCSPEGEYGKPRLCTPKGAAWLG